MDAEKMEYLGMDKVVQEMAMKAAETADRFIFETVLPFCQENYQGGLKKEDLSRALGLLKAQEPQTVIVEDIPKDGTWFGIWFGRCPNCKEMLTKKYHKHFCGNCGQAVKWDG